MGSLLTRLWRFDWSTCDERVFLCFFYTNTPDVFLFFLLFSLALLFSFHRNTGDALPFFLVPFFVDPSLLFFSIGLPASSYCNNPWMSSLNMHNVQLCRFLRHVNKPTCAAYYENLHGQWANLTYKDNNVPIASWLWDHLCCRGSWCARLPSFECRTCR